MRKFPLNRVRGRHWTPARRFRGWLALWLQDRRRSRQSPPVPAAPVIISGGFEWDATTPGLADVWLDWSFDHGAAPVASLEVWFNIDHGADTLLVTLASTETGYYYAEATNTEHSYYFKVRYRNGETLGPFSAEYLIEVVV